jgi:stress-induced morphogen
MSSFAVSESIREKLTAAFDPTHLDVINESHMHNVYVRY